MKRARWMLAVLCLVSCGRHDEATDAVGQYILNPNADTWIDADSVDSNEGGTQLLRVQGRHQVTLMHFDPDTVREAVGSNTLASATLRLWIVTGFAGSGMLMCDPSGYEIRRVRRTWTEAGATWRCSDDGSLGDVPDTDCPTPDLWNFASATPFDPANLSSQPFDPSVIDTEPCTDPGDGAALHFDVTSDVVTMLGAGATTHEGWVIRGVSDVPDVFASREITIDERTHPPELILHFVGENFAPFEPTPPPIDRSAPTHVYTAMSWILDPLRNLQLGTTETIHPNRASLVRGNVYDRDTGFPLAGVRVSVVGRASAGEARTRQTSAHDPTGNYELLVNGGGAFTLQFEAPGHLTAQRTIDVPWNDWVRVPDVALVPTEELACGAGVNMTGTTGMMVPGPVRAEGSATRQTAVWLPARTYIRSGATGTPTPGYQLCMGEYTRVAATEDSPVHSREDAMPAELPGSTSYTFAAGVEVWDPSHTTQISQPQFVSSGGVPTPALLYVRVADPILPSTPGDIVPNGSYDLGRTSWAAEENGRIVAVSGGSSMCSIDTGGVTLIPAMTADEQAALCALGSGTYYRVPVHHFSLVDLNWLAQVLGLIPRDSTAGGGSNPNCSGASGGSIIYCDRAALGERFAITGTPYSLMYLSHRQAGRREQWHARVQPAPMDAGRCTFGGSRVHLELLVAGTRARQPSGAERVTLPASGACTSTDLVWDGTNAYGQTLVGPQRAYVRIGYEFDLRYLPMSGGPVESCEGGSVTCDVGAHCDAMTDTCVNESAFASIDPSVTTAEMVGAHTLIAWITRRVTVGTIDDHISSLGGIGIDAHHFYDPATSTLFMGDGSERSTESSANTLRTVATSNQDDGIPAITVGPAGDLYYFDADSSSRHLRVVMRGASVGSAQNVGIETFDNVRALAIGRAPSLGRDVLYVLEGERSTAATSGQGCVIYRVDPSARSGPGVIDMIGRRDECTGGGLPALRRPIRTADLSLSRTPSALSVAGDGSIFLVSDGQLMRIVDTSAGGHVEDLYDGAVGPMSLGPDGTLFFAADGCVSGGSEHCIARRRTDGVIATALAPGLLDVGDGAQACINPTTVTDSCARIGVVQGIALDVDRNLCWSEAASTAAPTHPGRVRCVRPGASGDLDRVYTIAGLRSDSTAPSPSSPSSATLAPATRVDLGLIGQLAQSPDGRIYVVDGLGASPLGGQSRVVVVEPTLDGDLSADHVVASSHGTMLYRFNGSGRHLSTVEALSGAVVTSFDYVDDPTSVDFGRLTGITDAEGRRTSIVRDGARHIVVTAPGGVITRLTLDADDGYVVTVADPAASTWSLAYTSLPGLLTQMTDARGFNHGFAYDDGPSATGRLLSDTRPPADLSSSGAPVSLQLPALVTSELSMDPDHVPWRDVTESEAPDPEISSASALQTHYRVRGLATGVLDRELVHGDPAGTTATRIHASVPADGSTLTTTAPDGSTVVSVLQPDPRPLIGMDAPYAASTVVTRPSGTQTSVDRAMDTPSGTLTDTATIHGDPATPDGTADVVVTRLDTPSASGRVVTTVAVANHPDRTVTVTRQGTRLTRIDMPGQGPVCLFYPDTTSHRPNLVQRMPFAESLCNAPDPSGAVRQVALTYSDSSSTGSPRWLRTITAGTGATALTTSMTPDSRGWPSSVSLPGRSHALVPTFDAHGNLTSFQPPGDPAHTFTYTGRDSLSTYTSPSGIEVTESRYRPDGRLSSRTFTGATAGGRGFTVHVSSTTGYVSSLATSGDGVLNDVIQVASDATVGGRPTALAGSMDAIDLLWDGSVLTDQSWTTGGTLAPDAAHVSGGSAVGRVHRSVDGRMLPTDERACIGSTCTSITSGQLVHYGYDDGRLLTSAGIPTQVPATLAYVFNPHTASGGVLSGTTVTTTTGVIVTETNLTTLGELDHISANDGHGHGAASQLYSTQICARDSLGRITRRVESVTVGHGHPAMVAWDYEYNARGFLSRAVSATPPTGNACAAEHPRPRSRTLSDQSFTYDDAGNRSDLAVGTVGDDRARVGGRQYNAMGQLTQMNTVTGGPFGGTRTFGYDVLGRLRTTTQHNPSPPPGTPMDITTSYETDPLGRLMAITPGIGARAQAQRFVYRDVLEPIAWQRPTRTTRCAGGHDTAYFVYATSMHTPDLMYVDECSDALVDHTYRVLYDERGSVRLVVDIATSAAVQQIDYDVWGAPTFVPASSEGFQPFGFIGGIWDGETGLWRLGARDYDPRIGRWTTEDPIGFGGGTNLYAYCMNDPVNHSDLFGLDEFPWVPLGPEPGGPPAPGGGGVLAALLVPALSGGASAAFFARAGGASAEGTRMAALFGGVAGLLSGASVVAIFFLAGEAIPLLAIGGAVVVAVFVGIFIGDIAGMLYPQEACEAGSGPALSPEP